MGVVKGVAGRRSGERPHRPRPQGQGRGEIGASRHRHLSSGFEGDLLDGRLVAVCLWDARPSRPRGSRGLASYL